jgi:2-(1,2-epoxy-1,2-dihydrophenyl)acetyl-CoA isomerase
VASVTLQREGAVGVLTLNRPDNANVLNLPMARELLAAVRELEADTSIRAVLLTGAGKHFCFGGDLRGMLTQSAAENASGDPRAAITAYLLELTGDLHAAIVGLVQLDAPVIAVVNGTAAGAGVGLVAMADLALCGSSTRFSLAYTGVALTPDGGTSFFLPRLIGAKRAMDWLLSNRLVTAEEARSVGLVNEVVADAQLLDHARALAARLAAGPRHAFAKTKRLLSVSRSELEYHLALEGRTIAQQAASSEGLEGMRAFLDKRRPVFEQLGHTP